MAASIKLLEADMVDNEYELTSACYTATHVFIYAWVKLLVADKTTYVLNSNCLYSYLVIY